MAGIDAEIAAAIAEKLNLELQIDDMEFDSITEAIKGGKADIGMAGMTVTPDRQEGLKILETEYIKEDYAAAPPPSARGRW